MYQTWFCPCMAGACIASACSTGPINLSEVHPRVDCSEKLWTVGLLWHNIIDRAQQDKGLFSHYTRRVWGRLHFDGEAAGYHFLHHRKRIQLGFQSWYKYFYNYNKKKYLPFELFPQHIGLGESTVFGLMSCCDTPTVCSLHVWLTHYYNYYY